jgi:hypothetical protein
VARKVLLDVDDELLEQFDSMWRACGFPSRRAAIRHALEVAVAQHHAHAQRERAAIAEPHRWLPGPLHTGDWAGEERSRPITFGLMDDGRSVAGE